MTKQVSLMSKFDKELFKKNVIDNVKTLYRKTLDEATPQQIFQSPKEERTSQFLHRINRDYDYSI